MRIVILDSCLGCAFRFERARAQSRTECKRDRFAVDMTTVRCLADGELVQFRFTTPRYADDEFPSNLVAASVATIREAFTRLRSRAVDRKRNRRVGYCVSGSIDDLYGDGRSSFVRACAAAGLRGVNVVRTASNKTERRNHEYQGKA